MPWVPDSGCSKREDSTSQLPLAHQEKSGFCCKDGNVEKLLVVEEEGASARAKVPGDPAKGVQRRLLVHGEGECVYLNDHFVASSSCSQHRPYACSKPQAAMGQSDPAATARHEWVPKASLVLSGRRDTEPGREVPLVWHPWCLHRCASFLSAFASAQENNPARRALVPRLRADAGRVRPQQSESPGSCKNTTENVGDGNATLGNVCLDLRKALCVSELREAEGCKLCPVNWTLHGTKCYWVANGVRVWSASRDDCGNRGAELLMPGDRDELVKGAMASGVWDGVWDCARGAGGFSLKCIKDKKVPIGVTVVVAALLLTIIALAAAPVLPSCLEDGIGYREKCFYFVEDEADWNRSQSSCLSLGAHLAAVDTREELRFLLRYGSRLHYWVGLRREGSGPWKWFNGSLFNNLFDVRGEGQCAYVNADGISSDWCSQMKYSICSHPQSTPRFLLRYGSRLHYWVGLRREGSGPWKWFNGSLFNNLFDVRGEGQCAYVNADGISSDWCSQMKYSICSHPQSTPAGLSNPPEPRLELLPRQRNHRITE
nr:PREDICTED: uncharacterized protein LOC104332287 [Opisthocomus hoazin]